MASNRPEMITGLSELAWTPRAIGRSTTSAAVPFPERHRLAISQRSTISPRRRSIRTPASNAAAVISLRGHFASGDHPIRSTACVISRVIEEECGRLQPSCVNVCPVENCITMEPLAAGTLDRAPGKTGRPELRQLDDPSEQPDGAASRRVKTYESDRRAAGHHRRPSHVSIASKLYHHLAEGAAVEMREASGTSVNL